MEFLVLAGLLILACCVAGALDGDLWGFLKNEWRLMRADEWTRDIYDSSDNPRPCGRLDPRCQATLRRQMEAREWMKKAGIPLVTDSRKPYHPVITKENIDARPSAKVLRLKRKVRP